MAVDGVSARMKLRLAAIAVMVGCATISASGCEPIQSSTPAPSVSSTAWTATGAAIRDRLQRVSVIDALPRVSGYDRDCGPGHACTFGPSWTDDNDGPSGHDGCDERNQILRTQLRNVEFRSGSKCVVVAGVLDPEPYAGKAITFAKSDASKVQIDHRLALARAFALGAHAWSQEERIAFSNDTAAELIAVDGSANMSKGDDGLEWLPTNVAYRCQYVSDYLAVSVKYKLPITAGDKAAADKVARSC